MRDDIVYMRRTGRGSPVVFLGGCPTFWDVLSPIAAAISTTHEAIEVALPGYGASPALPGKYTLPAAQAAVEAALLDAGVRECAVVGFSGGGYRALSLACSGNVRVTHVLSLAGLAGLTTDESAGFRGFAAAVRAGQDLRALAVPRFLSASFAAVHAEAAQAVQGWLSAAPPEVIAAELDAFAEAEDLTPALGALLIPIVARVGSADVASPPPKSEAIARACRSARLEIVDGAGHALVYEDVGGTIEALRRLLARAPLTSGESSASGG